MRPAAQLSRFERAVLRWLVLPLLTALSASAADVNLVHDAGFEEPDFHVAWTNFSPASIGKSTNAFSGQYAGAASNRSSTLSGIAQDMRGVFSSGVTYLVSAWIRVEMPEGVTNQRVQMNMKEDYAGSAVDYTSICNQAIPDHDWIRAAGLFRYTPTGAEEDLRLYFIGPATNYTILVDEVSVLGPPNY